jgi:hypothetical protein
MPELALPASNETRCTVGPESEQSYRWPPRLGVMAPFF